MNYCDLHCDTPLALYQKGERLCKNSCNVSLEKASVFERYVQLAAYCPAFALSDSDAETESFKVYECFKEEISVNGCVLCKNGDDLKSAKTPAFILTLEDARLVSSVKTADRLFEEGVRIVTPLWGGESIIGGSHESDKGLSERGIDIVSYCVSLGMIPDISHASPRSADDIFNICAKYSRPAIASHSCSYELNPHTRNLRESQAKTVKALGGIIGANLYPYHLKGETATVQDVINHISHFAVTVGINGVCLGCDFDGIDKFTENLRDISDIPQLKTELGQRFSLEECEKICFSNAYNFLLRNLCE